jgi:4-hydroxythreonine-4-phosphate dehydrogenase
MTGWIGISIGDATGVGPEVTLKAVAAEATSDDTRYFLIGDYDVIASLNARLGTNLPLATSAAKHADSRFVVYSSHQDKLPAGLPAGDAAAARAAVTWLRDGAHLCLSKQADAFVTAPVSKEAIINAGYPAFVGQTEFLSDLANAKRTAMMLLGADDRGRWLRVALATTHVPIRDVADKLTPEKIKLAIELAANACRDLGLSRHRVAVCGLNPHAGEGGKMGTEEITMITPAVNEMKQRGYDVAGPAAADTLFHYVFRGDYDAVVAMYHDQGLVPLKMIGFENGINWTLGLPFIRTSPDHGTAYDIAGKGIANPSSMRSALQLAKRLARGKA